MRDGSGEGGVGHIFFHYFCEIRGLITVVLKMCVRERYMSLKVSFIVRYGGVCVEIKLHL